MGKIRRLLTLCCIALLYLICCIPTYAKIVQVNSEFKKIGHFQWRVLYIEINENTTIVHKEIQSDMAQLIAYSKPYSYIEDLNTKKKYYIMESSIGTGKIKKKLTTTNPIEVIEKYEAIPSNARITLYDGTIAICQNLDLSKTKTQIQDESLNLLAASPTYENRKEELVINNISSPEAEKPLTWIDVPIQTSITTNSNTFGIIISNEKYKYVEDVPFANHDGEVLKRYFEETLRIPSQNIRFIADATGNDIKYAINWAQTVSDAYNGNIKLIFYYSGHGIPNDKSYESYLLPVDAYPSDITTAFPLDSIYAKLSYNNPKSILVLLDACFSGTKKDGSMIVSSRGVKVKVKNSKLSNNIVVLSATKGDETAFPYSEKKHGLFTYFLLKGIKESHGQIKLGDLSTLIINEVKKTSITINGNLQTPTVNPSFDLVDSWKEWTIY